MAEIPVHNQPHKRRGVGKPFQPGKSGNPAGKPSGTRSAALAALDAIGEAGARGVLEKIVEQAREGDVRAAEIILRRCWPERKGRPLEFGLPTMKTAADLVEAIAAVSAAMAAGVLTTEEAAAAASVLETHRRVIDTSDLAARVAALEAGRGGAGT
jgi:hypothetical protein